MSEAGGYLCPQRMSDGASLWEEKVCPDCPLTKNLPERGLERLLELSTMFNRSTDLGILLGLIPRTSRGSGGWTRQRSGYAPIYRRDFSSVPPGEHGGFSFSQRRRSHCMKRLL